MASLIYGRLSVFFVLSVIIFGGYNCSDEYITGIFLTDNDLLGVTIENVPGVHSESLIFCCAFCILSNSMTISYNPVSELCKCSVEMRSNINLIPEIGSQVYHKEIPGTEKNVTDLSNTVQMTTGGTISTTHVTTSSEAETTTSEAETTTTVTTTSTQATTTTSTPISTTTSVDETTTTTTTATTTTTGDIGFGFGIVNVSCPNNNEIITNLITEYDNNVNDRKWDLQCTTFSDTLHSCYWTGFINDWHGNTSPLYYDCNNNGIVVGIYSIFNSTLTDRRYKLLCCEMTVKNLNTSTYAWANMGYTQDLTIAIPSGHVIYNILSTYSDPYKDRQLKIRHCLAV